MHQYEREGPVSRVSEDHGVSPNVQRQSIMVESVNAVGAHPSSLGGISGEMTELAGTLKYRGNHAPMRSAHRHRPEKETARDARESVSGHAV